MAALHTELVTGSWHPSCYRPSDPVAHTDRPRGKACNAPPGAYGSLPPAAQKAAGDALAASLQASAARTDVHYLIWYGRIWNADRAHDGWRPYQGAGVYNTTPTTRTGSPGATTTTSTSRSTKRRNLTVGCRGSSRNLPRNLLGARRRSVARPGLIGLFRCSRGRCCWGSVGCW